MTNNVINHYDDHLGPIYAWMVGDFNAASQQVNEYFDSINLQASSNPLVVDLGCGHGVQSVALAKRGYSVLAIDTCQQLLDSLAENAGSFAIKPVNDDLLTFEKHLESKVELIICMGDTLTHLSSLNDLESLLTSVANSLQPGGIFSVSFRDYASTSLEGTSRFIPVRSDENRIHTCFLEYDSDVVHVHDLIYDRTSTGWNFSTSVYDKLRLAPDQLKQRAESHGLSLSHETTIRGMLHWKFERSE